MLPQVFPTPSGPNRTFPGGESIPSQDGDRTGSTTLSHARSDCGVSACMDQGENRFTPIPIERSTKSPSRSGLGLSDLQHSAVAATGLEARPSSRGIKRRTTAPKANLLNWRVLLFSFRCACRLVFGSALFETFSRVLESQPGAGFESNFVNSFTASMSAQGGHRPPLQ